MIARIAKKEDKDRIKELWALCFGDAEAYIEYYFKRRFHENFTIVLEDEQHKIVSALQLNQYTMMLRGTAFETSYIVGVCTDPDHRGKGYMRLLMEKAYDMTLHMRQGFLLLKPVARALYLPYEFEYCFEFGPRDIEIPVGHEREDLWAMIHSYYKAMKNRNAYIIRDKEYYQELYLEIQTESGIVKRLEQGYIIYDEKTKAVREYIVDGQVRNSNLDIMARIIDVKTVFEKINFHPYDKVKIYMKIKDRFIEKNNGCFELSIANGTCTCNQVAIDSGHELNIMELTQLVFGYKHTGILELDALFPLMPNYFIEEV